MPSSVIKSFAYEAAERRLDIVFTSGRAYSYFDVPAETYAAMRASFSKGVFFNQHIRDHFSVRPA